MRTRRHLAAAVAALVLGACGQSEQERQAEQVEKAAEDVQKGAESMAKGLEEMAKGLGAMAGGDADAKPVDPVDFRSLQAALPRLEGWERDEPRGERMTMPVTFSEASVRFRRGDAEIEQKIVDSALNQLLIAPYTMFLTGGYERESSDGYERSTKIGEYPGWETWERDGRRGELNAVVAKRFLVQIEGRGIEDTKVLHALMRATDLGKLAALK